MHFIPEAIDNYTVAHTQAEPDILAQLTRETYQKILQPRMLSGHFQGRLLSILSKMVNPTTILELGTYTGYSAICLAEGLKENGELHTLDINGELQSIQDKYFELSGFRNSIHQHLGEALELLPTLNMKFDLVFMDADKPNYPAYFKLIIDKLNPGGILLTDNVLWSGKVVEALKKDDESTRALLEYNKLVATDPRLETVMLPIRDGLSLSRKKF